MKRTLDEVEERIHLIELRSEDPEVVQTQLDQCMVSNNYIIAQRRKDPYAHYCMLKYLCILINVTIYTCCIVLNA